MLDDAESWENIIAYVDLKEQKKVPKPPKDKLDVLAGPWTELKAHKVELKQLPTGQRYAFHEPNSTYHVIINSDLNNVKSALLFCELRKYHKALDYFLYDIPGNLEKCI